MIATHDRLFRKCHSCIQYKSACAAVYYLFIYLFYANYTKPTISPEHNVFGICDRPMCLTISLISAGKLPGCSVWALCPCLDLHAVMFSSFKHLCDTALFLASLAYLQETGMVFEGEKNTHSWIILQMSTQEQEEWIHPTHCLQRRLCRKEQKHV